MGVFPTDTVEVLIGKREDPEPLERFIDGAFVDEYPLVEVQAVSGQRQESDDPDPGFALYQRDGDYYLLAFVDIEYAFGKQITREVPAEVMVVEAKRLIDAEKESIVAHFVVKLLGVERYREGLVDVEVRARGECAEMAYTLEEFAQQLGEHGTVPNVETGGEGEDGDVGA